MHVPPSVSETVLSRHAVQADCSLLASVPEGQGMQIDVSLGIVPGGHASHCVLLAVATWFEAHAVQLPPATGEAVFPSHASQDVWFSLAW